MDTPVMCAVCGTRAASYSIRTCSEKCFRIFNALNPPPEDQGIGDVHSAAKGSGARYNSGKPDFSLIPLCTLEDEARVWAYGKQKYAAWNWTKGMPWSVPLACALRHLSAWQRGEENDPESNLPHLAHAMCNLRMLTLYATNYKEGDDRPVEQLK